MKSRDHEKYSMERNTTIISKDTVLETAKMVSKGSVHLQGEFIGDIEIESKLMVGESAKVHGNIKAHSVLVAGEIIGNLDVLHQLHITASGKIDGDIICGSIVVDENAIINSSCRIRNSENSFAKPTVPVSPKIETPAQKEEPTERAVPMTGFSHNTERQVDVNREKSVERTSESPVRVEPKVRVF